MFSSSAHKRLLDFAPRLRKIALITLIDKLLGSQENASQFFCHQVILTILALFQHHLVYRVHLRLRRVANPFHYQSTNKTTKTRRCHFVILRIRVIFVHQVIRFSEARRTDSQIERLHCVVLPQSIQRNRCRSHKLLVLIHHQHAFLLKMIHDAVVKVHFIVPRVVSRWNHEPHSVIIHFYQQSLTITSKQHSSSTSFTTNRCPSFEKNRDNGCGFWLNDRTEPLIEIQ